jgi:hypothetical protein
MMPPTLKGQIPIDYTTLRAGYPTYNKLPKHIGDYMDALNKGLEAGKPKNTPCCFQVSEAFNKAGAEHKITSHSYRRACAKLGSDYYLGAVDELEYFLAGRYGKGEDVHAAGGSGKDRTALMKASLSGRKGIICFRDGGYGAHTELWDGTDIVQNGAPAANGAALLPSYIWGQPRILFWPLAGEDGVDAAPAWLQGWWDVNDGNQYYYYFSDQYVCTYTKEEPATAFGQPARNAMNEGVVTLTDNPNKVAIKWNAADDGTTEETFTFEGTVPTTMRGKSNRYADLTATRKVTWKKKK